MVWLQNDFCMIVAECWVSEQLHRQGETARIPRSIADVRAAVRQKILSAPLHQSVCERVLQSQAWRSRPLHRQICETRSLRLIPASAAAQGRTFLPKLPDARPRCAAKTSRAMYLSSESADANRTRIKFGGMEAKHRVRVYAKAEIRLPRPILQIVPRFKSVAGEIGNFILRNPRRSQPIAGSNIKIGDGFFIGDKVRVVARPACHQFSAEPRILIYFEHVNTHVRRTGRDGFCQRELPAFTRSDAAIRLSDRC